MKNKKLYIMRFFFSFFFLKSIFFLKDSIFSHKLHIFCIVRTFMFNNLHHSYITY